MTLYDNAMRTIVNFPQQDVQKLDALCQKEHISRAEAVRRAVSLFLKAHQDDNDAAFGIWKQKNRDGLIYQNRQRDEWESPTIHEPNNS